MADFTTPFASAAERRMPTTDERQNGFPCGPADQRLFNGLFHRLESEVGSVLTAAGLTQSDSNLGQLAEAVQALIDAATGGGDPETYLLLAQARARLPIFPEVLTTTGKLTVTSPGVGVARLGGGATFTHRGIFNVTTSQTDFNTDASKTYHLRWNPTDGFSLKDLASPTYNPTAAAETSSLFDSKFDDMLVARVISNSSNVLSITPLINKDRYEFSEEVGFLASSYTWQENTSPYGIVYGNKRDIDFARKPVVMLNGANDLPFSPFGNPTLEANVGVLSLSRYQAMPYFQVTGSQALNGLLSYTALMN